MEFYFNNRFLLKTANISNLQERLTDLGLAEPTDFYLLCNGKRVLSNNLPTNARIHIIPRLCGGKGGFGSMLRAIGAQIEKTTNREACRDLSGRRLRDINEEQRLKNWINTQVEREKEAAARKQKKLEKLCEEPKHEFKDETYDQLRSELPEKVEDAVTQGLKASCSSKRKLGSEKQKPAKKKAKLWIDEDLSDSCSSSGDEDDKASNSDSPKEESGSTEEQTKQVSCN